MAFWPLVWGLCAGEAGDTIKGFFLACVVIAGIFGRVHRKPENPVGSGIAGSAGVCGRFMGLV